MGGLGYSVMVDGVGSVMCDADGFLRDHVGGSYSWLSISIHNAVLGPPMLDALDSALKRTKAHFLQFEIEQAVPHIVAEAIPRICLLKPDRLVICPRPGFQEAALKDLLDEFADSGVWVETRGVPYCMTHIEHVWESYNGIPGRFPKDIRCAGCLLARACERVNTTPYGSLRPILKSSLAEDLNGFLGVQT